MYIHFFSLTLLHGLYLCSFFSQFLPFLSNQKRGFLMRKVVNPAHLFGRLSGKVPFFLGYTKKGISGCSTSSCPIVLHKRQHGKTRVEKKFALLLPPFLSLPFLLPPKKICHQRHTNNRQKRSLWKDEKKRDRITTD